MPKATRPEQMRCVLAIGGLDPGGGAGILADARAIGRAGAFACAAVAVSTVQTTAGLVTTRAVDARWLEAQCDAVLRHQRVAALKIGALGSAPNVRVVARLLTARPSCVAVLDPVVAPTRGAARLLASRAFEALRSELLPRVTLVTANAPEAALLSGRPVGDVRAAVEAASWLVAAGARAALVKGGHLAGDDAVDVLAVGRGATRRPEIVKLRLPRLSLPETHGGGCMLASLVAGFLAGAAATRRPAAADLVAAVRRARRVHRAALERLRDVGGPLTVLVP